MRNLRLQGPSHHAYPPCRFSRLLLSFLYPLFFLMIYLLPSLIYLLPYMSLSRVLCPLDSLLWSVPSHQGVFDLSRLLFFLQSLLCPPLVQLSL